MNVLTKKIGPNTSFKGKAHFMNWVLAGGDNCTKEYAISAKQPNTFSIFQIQPK